MACFKNSILKEGKPLSGSKTCIAGLFILACIVLCTFSTMFARHPGSNASVQYPPLAGEIIHPVVQYSGSPNLFDRFTAGKVIMLSGDEVDADYLRYNVLTDDLVWMQPGEAGLVRIDKRLIRGFYLEYPGKPDSLMIFYRNEILQLDGYNCRDCFVQVLVVDDYSLYARRVKRISSRTETVVLSSGGESARMRVLQDDHSFLLVDPGKKNKRVGESTRAFVNAFPDQRRVLRRAMRRANVSISNDKQLVDAVRWLNEHDFD